MKRLILITVFLLNGCAVVDYYRMAKWDNNEYQLANEVQTAATLGYDFCPSQKDVVYYVDHIYTKSVEFKNYANDIERNEETVKMADNLMAITKGLKERYHSGDDVSQKYCELKMTSVQTSTGTIKKSLGAKPR